MTKHNIKIIKKVNKTAEEEINTNSQIYLSPTEFINNQRSMTKIVSGWIDEHSANRRIEQFVQSNKLLNWKIAPDKLKENQDDR